MEAALILASSSARSRATSFAAFARIERWTHPTTRAIHWRTWSLKNVRRVYGFASGAQHDPDRAGRVFE